MRHRAAARPALLGPVVLDVVHGRARPVADEAGEILEHLRAPLVGRQRRPRRMRGPADEAEEHAGRAVGRRVVEDRVRGPDVGDALAAEPGVAPEGALVDGLGLGQAPGHQGLQQRGLALGQRRRVGEARREHRRHGEDHLARLDRRAVGHDPHAVGILSDHPHRCAEHHAPAQAVGQLLADDLRAADEAPLLGAAAGGDQAQEGAGVLGVARGGRVLQRVEQRELLRIGAPDRLARGDEDRAPLLAGDLAPHPVVERRLVPGLGLLRRPRCAHAGPLGRGVEPGRGQDGLLHVGVVG